MRKRVLSSPLCSSLFSPINGAPNEIPIRITGINRPSSSPFPEKLGPRGSAEGTTEPWLFDDDTDDDDAIAVDNGIVVIELSLLEEGVRRVTALAVGALALVLPATLMGMMAAAEAGTREGESEAMMEREGRKRESKCRSNDA